MNTSQPRQRKPKPYRFALTDMSDEMKQAMELHDMADQPDSTRAQYQRDLLGPTEIPVSMSKHKED